MLNVVFDECYLAWSEELGLLRVLEVYIEDRSSKEWYQCRLLALSILTMSLKTKKKHGSIFKQ